MARSRFDKLEPEKQEAILTAAAAEFAERGFGAASLNRIIKRARTSKGSLYYYFNDKADLFATVVERALTRVLKEVDWPGVDQLTAQDFWDRVHEITRRSLAVMRTNTWYMRITWAYHRLREEPDARAATAQLVDEFRDMTRAFVRRGRELGVVRSDLPLELLVEMSIAADEAGDRWMIRHWDEFTSQEQTHLIEARVDLVRDMLDARNVGWER
jgi:AcrR family transcriptional regulator